MEVFLLAAMAALVKKATDLFKNITNGDINGAVSIVVAWVIGAAVCVLAAQTNFATAFNPFGDQAFSDWNTWTLIFAGLNIGSTGSVVFYDIPHRLDSTTPTPEQHLLPKQASRKKRAS